MSLIMVAHGTRKPEGVLTVGELAERVGRLLREAVHVSFVDVLGPTPTEVLADVADSGRPAVVVPAFLSRGYHVCADLPAHLLASAHPDVTVTPALGPGPRTTAVLVNRLNECGWRPGDSVILAAAGTSSAAGQADLRRAAQLLSAQLGSDVAVAFAATGTPGVAEAVADLRSRGARRVVIASYLLAEGLFQQRLREAGADLVSEPLGTHTGITRLIAQRFSRARIMAARPSGPSRLLGDGEQQRGVLHGGDRVHSGGGHQ